MQVNFYAGLALERFAERRDDEAYLLARRSDPAARFVPVWRARSLIGEGEIPAARFLPRLAVDVETTEIYLGEMGGAAYFAVDVSRLDEAALPGLHGDGAKFVDLRAVGAFMERQEGGLLAYARGLAHWHQRHRFCGLCGAPTVSRAGGHVRRCANPDCVTDHFPRTDPAVIMLVTRGERCFLGKNGRFPFPMYSTLAGFVEPGESLEDAVTREVFEETALRVVDVRYRHSQPWPFPASIMLGFQATALDEEFRLDPAELVDGGWYDRDFLRAAHSPEAFRLPRADSIARRLIDDWIAEG